MLTLTRDELSTKILQALMSLCKIGGRAECKKATPSAACAHYNYKTKLLF